jgi:hypothetical protein
MVFGPDTYRRLHVTTYDIEDLILLHVRTLASHALQLAQALAMTSRGRDHRRLESFAVADAVTLGVREMQKLALKVAVEVQPQ